MRRPNTILGLVGLLLGRGWERYKAAVCVALVFSGLAVSVTVLLWPGDKPTYSQTIDEVVGAPEFVGKRMRVAGTLCDSAEVNDTTGEFRFILTSPRGEKAMRVSMKRRPVPDPFFSSGQLDVVVEGTLGANGVFSATLVLGQCPSKYDPGAHGEPGAHSAWPLAPRCPNVDGARWH
jgi:cytochrome c-type biogenesis protein CcmE